MAAKDLREQLRTVSIFRDLSERELRALAKLVREVSYGAGQDVVREGESGGACYVIVRGRAKVIVNGRTKRTVGPGGFFGEMSLLDREARAATVRAETPLDLLALTSVNFGALLQEHWSITAKVLADLSRRVRILDRSANE